MELDRFLSFLLAIGHEKINACYLFAAIAINDLPIRLCYGSSEYFGGLEVFYNGTWGTVCDDLFGTEEAQLACRQLCLLQTNLQCSYPRNKLNCFYRNDKSKLNEDDSDLI